MVGRAELVVTVGETDELGDGVGAVDEAAIADGEMAMEARGLLEEPQPESAMIEAAATTSPTMRCLPNIPPGGPKRE